MFISYLIKRLLVGAVLVAAVSFSAAAQAAVIGGGGGGGAVVPSAARPAVQHRLAQLQGNVQQGFAAEGGWHLSAPSTPAAATSSAGFQWGDAGIGAAGATVLLGAGGLGVAMTRRRRRVAMS